jgi:DNA-binding SARP family transcriptional activator
MISSIVDVAYELAARLLEDGDAPGAQDAAARGLRVDPANESLHRISITAALARGDLDDAARLETRLRIQLEDIDPDASAPLLT